MNYDQIHRKLNTEQLERKHNKHVGNKMTRVF